MGFNLTANFILPRQTLDNYTRRIALLAIHFNRLPEISRQGWRTAYIPMYCAQCFFILYFFAIIKLIVIP
jgi:hypothetical protein